MLEDILGAILCQVGGTICYVQGLVQEAAAAS